MKLTTKEKKTIEDLIKKYQKILLLDMYDIKLIESTENKEAMAECKFTYPYLNAKIHINPDLIRNKDSRKLESVIVHEMCHMVTDPFYSKAVSRYISKYDMEDERERLTDHVCNIILKNK